MTNYFSEDAGVMAPSPIRKLSAYLSNPDVISFAGGHPAVSAFPVEEIELIIDELKADFPPLLLQYGMTRGNKKLIEFSIAMLNRRGIPSTDQNVMLTGGSQRGLDLIGRVLIDPGDTVLVEVPSYPGALACFRNLRANLIGIKQDGQGLITSELVKTLEKCKSERIRPKALYTIPNFQNPSGTTLAKERRAELAELSERYDFLIIEDDPYGELYFDESTLRDTIPVASFNPDRVIYAASFSKILAPGLRTGLVRASADIAAKLELCAQASDLCSSTLDQHLVLKLCENGKLEKNLSKIRKYYREKGKALIAALEKSMPEDVSWNPPKGGFFLWLTLPEHIDSSELLKKTLEDNVIFVPGIHFCADGSGK
ncbi:MAG: PLP-dependent aminotransferase family protein, partial [Rhodospirillales bacterium]|nr:PLP-dependent aminotransferase family protein [Rhodospirillales bacterium]